MWIERKLKKKIQQAAETRSALLLTGPRQTGKSSLLKRQFPDADYLTFKYEVSCYLAQNINEQ